MKGLLPRDRVEWVLYAVGAVAVLDIIRVVFFA